MNRKRNNRIWIGIGSVLCIGALSFMFRHQEEKPLQSSAHGLLQPVALIFSETGFWFQQHMSFLTSISNLKKENEQFYAENLELKAQIAQLHDVKAENDLLRQQLELAPRTDYQLTAALITGRDIGQQGEQVYINKGQVDGIQTGQAVIVGKGVVVGKVVNVFEHDASVELLLSRDIRVMAEILESHEKGLVKGDYGTSVIIDNIPQTVELKSGDTVITTDGEIIPRGLLIGYVKEATQTPDQLFQRASLILPAKMQQLRMVWVVNNEKKP